MVGKESKRLCHGEEEDDDDVSTNVNNEATELNAIEMQKARAIRFWNDSNYGEELKGSVHDVVMKHLNQGLVLPIIHTLCRDQNKRLFSPNATVCVDKPDSGNIHLSSSKVHEGKSGSEEIGEVSNIDDMSYLEAFFVDGITARSKVKDRALTWEFHENYTRMVTALVNTPSSMKGEDIEVTKLVDVFQVDEGTGYNLITRRLSRGVVADCFLLSKRNSIHAIVGTPGIGKSWTLLYALQQALLYENACVVLYYQKRGRAIACIRKNDLIYVWQVDDGSLKGDCDMRLFFNSNVLVLLDPRASKKGGAAIGEGRRMLIMAASNNENHFSDIEKVTPAYDRFLSQFTNRELVVALPWMIEGQDKAPTLDEMIKMAQAVGNLPRYILNEESFDKRQ
jgi:hypothetical protein